MATELNYMIAHRWIVQALKIAMTAIILGLLAWQFDFRAAVEKLSSISFGAVAASIGVVLLQSFVLAIRLASIVSIFKAKLRLSESYRVTLESMFFSQTFVSFVGGDGFRIWRIRRLGLPLADATSVIVLDRLAGTVVNHICLLASLPWLLMILPAGLLRLVLLILAATGVAGFTLLLLLGFLRGRLGIFRRLPERIRIASVIILLLEAITVGRHFLANWYRLTAVFGFCALIAICNMLVFALILLGMGVELSLAVACALLVPAILEIAMLPISIAGWGLREGATVLAFGALGLMPDRALGASVAFGLILTAVSLLGGILWLVDRHQMSVISIEPENDAGGAQQQAPEDRSVHSA